ncbi:inhibin beta B chain-like [Scylla paramamosain]|uniref:inhibin beta B chain-like n=1 Tax=Scylla paramamosain TaxID=85552 RepID=UPI003082BB19
MTISLRLLPVLAGALALLPLAVPGVGGMNPLSLIRNLDNIRINEIGSREVTSASPEGSTVSSRHLRFYSHERIKERILAKMQLSEEPRFHQPLEKLPDIIREGLSQVILPQQPPSTQAPPTLEKASILLASQRKPCRGRRGVLCLRFTLGNSTMQDVTTTTLWLWKTKDQRQTKNIFFVNEGNPRGNRTLLAKASVTETLDGWVKLDISAAMQRWMLKETQEVNLNVWCSTCSRHALTSKIADHTPFIVIAATETNTHQRRSVERECSGQDGDRCCREAINITSTEMGWDDWLISPRNFAFYYCNGSCPAYPLIDETFNGTEYSKIKKHLMQEGKLGPRDKLKPCCSPTSYKSMDLLFYSGTREIRHRRVTDLLVSSCGCRD